MSIETTTMSDQSMTISEPTTTMSIHTLPMSLETSTLPSFTGTHCPLPVPTGLPSDEPGCFAPIKGNLTDGFYYCCIEGAAFYNDCAVVCRALGQDVDDLSDCLDDYTGENPEIVCGTGLTANPTPRSTSPGASSSATSSATGSATSPSASSTENVAFTNRPISTTGISVLAMLFCSTMMGLLA